MKLTKRVLDRLVFDPARPMAQQIHWDDELPGFGVRLQPAGTRAFVVRYRAPDGRSRLMTLGRYGKVTLQQARTAARRVLASVLEGGDPAAARRAKRDALTLGHFADEYVLRHAQPRKRTWKEDQRRLGRTILPAFGTRKLAGITRADVAALHAALSQTPYEANRTVRLLTTMRSVAMEWGHLPHDTPPWSVKLYEEQSRDRWVRPEELPHLLDAIAAETSPHVRGALLLALLTGMRRGEILGLRWQDVDLERREIHLATTKAKRSHTIPLSPEAVSVLSSLPRLLGNPYCFAAERLPGTHIHDLKEPWERVRARLWLATHPGEAAELRERAEAHVRRHGGNVAKQLRKLAHETAKARGETLRLHDVRRTTGSMLALAGASLPLIGKVLNHSNPSTTQIYARLTEDAPRAALDALGEQVRAARTAHTTGRQA